MRKSLLTLLLAFVLASMLLAVFATTYNVSISEPLWWLATWSAYVSPSLSISLPILPVTMWSAWVAPPTTVTLTLATVPLWKAATVFTFQDYMNKTRVLEFYVTPPLISFPKNVIDGSLVVYTNEPSRFFYNYTGMIVVEGGNATPTEGGYLINTGAGYTYV